MSEENGRPPEEGASLPPARLRVWEEERRRAARERIRRAALALPLEVRRDLARRIKGR